MSDVAMHPVTTMPGDLSTPPAGTACDNHSDYLATKRMQGETDSMGCEYHDLCEQCVADYRAAARQARVGKCDWCKSQVDDLRPRRDYEEGLAGRLYDVCGACVKRDKQHYAEWLDDYADDYDR